MPATPDVSTNMHNLKHGKGHAKRVKDQGKAGSHKQEVAIALSEARKAGGKVSPKSASKAKSMAKHKARPKGFPAKKKGK